VKYTKRCLNDSTAYGCEGRGQREPRGAPEVGGSAGVGLPDVGRPGVDGVHPLEVRAAAGEVERERPGDDDHLGCMDVTVILKEPCIFCVDNC
jgi:hypothetical protein